MHTTVLCIVRMHSMQMQHVSIVLPQQLRGARNARNVDVNYYTCCNSLHVHMYAVASVLPSTSAPLVPWLLGPVRRKERNFLLSHVHMGWKCKRRRLAKKERVSDGVGRIGIALGGIGGHPHSHRAHGGKRAVLHGCSVSVPLFSAASAPHAAAQPLTPTMNVNAQSTPLLERSMG